MRECFQGSEIDVLVTFAVGSSLNRGTGTIVLKKVFIRDSPYIILSSERDRPSIQPVTH